MSLSFSSHTYLNSVQGHVRKTSNKAWCGLKDEAFGDLGRDKAQKACWKDFWIFSRALRKKLRWRAEEKNWITNATQLDGLRISIFISRLFSIKKQSFFNGKAYFSFSMKIRNIAKKKASSFSRKFVVTIRQTATPIIFFSWRTKFFVTKFFFFT